MSFPSKRLRRLRRSEKIRELIQETRLSPKDFICPIFVQEDLKSRQKIESMPDIERLALDEVVDEVGKISDLNIPAVMVFGVPSKKDDIGSSAFDENGIVQKVISKIRENFGEKIAIMADVCLCQYTTSGWIKENDVVSEITSRYANAGLIMTMSTPSLISASTSLIASLRFV